MTNKKRTKFDKNEIVIYDSYAEIILYNIKNLEVARTIINLSDVEKASKRKWRLSNGYAVSTINGTTIRLNRFLLDVTDDLIIVDHKNLNRLDNTRENLRICTQTQNCQNVAITKRNSSGIKGVSLDAHTGKWRATIHVNGKQKSLGRFINKINAIRVRKEAEIKYFGEFNYKEG